MKLSWAEAHRGSIWGGLGEPGHNQGWSIRVLHEAANWFDFGLAESGIFQLHQPAGIGDVRPCVAMDDGLWNGRLVVLFRVLGYYRFDGKAGGPN